MTDELIEPEAATEQYRVTAGELRAFVERVERLEEEKAKVSDGIKAVYAEAKARGYDVAVMKRLIADRKKDPSEVQEEEAVLELYRDALATAEAEA